MSDLSDYAVNQDSADAIKALQASLAAAEETWAQRHLDEQRAAMRMVEKAEARLAAAEAENERLREALKDAVTVIERMANGASREACSPELDRVLVFVSALATAPDGEMR